MSSLSDVAADRYTDFIKKVAKFPATPRRMETLLHFLQHKGLELVDPAARAGLHPFFIPVATDGKEMTGLLRWPTAPETLEMPVVRCGEAGLELLANNAEHYIRRSVAEIDWQEGADAPELIRLANEGLRENDPPYVAGDVKKMGYGLSRYLALRVGPFADVYESLCEGHLSKGDAISALSCAEKANDIFVGWGRPYGYYARVLDRLPNRGMEAKDSAKVALRCASWTLSPDPANVAEVVRIAGYPDVGSVRDLYTRLANDEQRDKIVEGKAPMQVALDRASHLMDAVAFGYKSWDEAKEEMAERYVEGGLPEIAEFVKA